jgi:hypothetical protein
MNARRLVLVVDRCAPTPSGRTTVAVALDTDWTLMGTLAKVYAQFFVRYFWYIIVHIQTLTNALKVQLAVIKSVPTPLAATHALATRAII